MTIIILISIKKCIIICWLFTTLNPSTSCIATRSKLYLINSLATVFSETCPVEAPNISCFKSHIRFPLARSFQRIHPNPRLCVTFHKKLIFYGEEFLAPHPTPKLKGHPLLAVYDCLFNIFAATSIIGGHLLHNLRMCHAMVTGTHIINFGHLSHGLHFGSH